MIHLVVIPVLVYVVLPLLAGLAVVLVRRRVAPWAPLARRAPATSAGVLSEVDDLRERLRDLLRTVPRAPSLASGALGHPLSLQVEARLLAGCPSQALEEAEQHVLEHPADTAALPALAKALLYCRREEEARAALRWAQRRGADDPEFDYLAARLGGADLEALRRCLRACQREPGYPEALYLCARLCLRLGFAPEGEQLLRQIAPLMQLSVERLSYRAALSALENADAQARARERERLSAAPRGAARRLLSRLSASSWGRGAGDGPRPSP